MKLVRALVVALESGRLKIARRIPLAGALMRELAAFRVKVSQRGHDTYEGRGEHDDLVIATALAVWAIGCKADTAKGGGLPAMSGKATQRPAQRDRLLRGPTIRAFRGVPARETP